MSDFELYTLIIEAVSTSIDALVPALLAIGGVILHRYTKTIDHRLDVERESVARSSLRFEELSTLINDIYCFTVVVGHYRDISPADAIESKRRLEHVMFSTLPMWKDSMVQAARDFIDACYVTKRGPGMPLLLGSDIVRQKQERHDSWKSSWDELFLTVDARREWIEQEFGVVNSYRNDVVKIRYAHLLAEISRVVGGQLSEATALDMLRRG